MIDDKKGAEYMDFYAVGMELARGIGFFFLNPLLYILLLFALFLGVRRVQRERNHFHIRVYDFIDDLTVPLLPGIIAGLACSIATIVFGIVLPIGAIALIAIIHVLILITCQVRWLSFAYSGAILLVVALILPKFETGVVFIDRWLVEIYSVNLTVLALLVSLLIIIEGLLIMKVGAKQTSPMLAKSKRGKNVGAHEAKRMWILPVFFFVPIGLFPTFDVWPVLNDGSFSQIGLMAMPLAVGFQQRIRTSLPEEAVNRLGKQTAIIGLLVLGISAAAAFFPFLIPVVALVALIAREAVYLSAKHREDKSRNIYTEKEDGLIIVGVIPQSPAAKMAVTIGEIVTKVNGINVRTPQQFYEALQINPAFCKLEIIDWQNEARFVQTAVYDGEHHQIGLLFVEQRPETSIRGVS